MGITFLGGYTTHEAAEEHRQKYKYKDLYTIASVFDISSNKNIAHFIIPNKAADAALYFNETTEPIGKAQEKWLSSD